MNKDYFLILGVEKTATADQIKNAFLKKAIMFHPDKIKKGNKTNAELEELKKIYTNKYLLIQEAYKTLSNPEKLVEYKQGLNSTFIDLKDNYFNETGKINVPDLRKGNETLSEAFERITREQNPDFFINQKEGIKTSINDRIIEEKMKERDNEIQQEKLFNSENLDYDEFNLIFEKYKKKNEELNGPEVVGEIVPFDMGNESIFSYKNSLVEIDNTDKLLSFVGNSSLNDQYTGFKISDLSKNISEDIKSGEFKDKPREAQKRLTEKDFDNFYQNHTIDTKKYEKYNDKDFIVKKTEVELNHPNLFVDMSNLEEIGPVPVIVPEE